MNRSLWKQPITDDALPPWQCPVCNLGVFRIIPKSLRHEETTPSKQLHSDEEWEPFWIQTVFTTWGQCDNKKCAQFVAIAGKGGVDETGNVYEEGPQFTEAFRPMSCQPMPRIIELPPKTPEKIVEELEASFRSFWNDTTATANHIRTAVEHLMTFVRITRRTKKGNKFIYRNLHQRIEAFSIKNSIIGSQLMAIKWLGNSGSHGEEIEKHDLLDAFEIIEHVLDELLTKKSAHFSKLATDLTKRHKRRN